MILQSITLAFRQLWRNKVRTALTSLGLLIGVAAVICLVAIGRGATAKIQKDLESFGNNLVFVMPGNEGPGGRSVAKPFREDDARALAGLDGVLRAVPTAARQLRAVRADKSWKTAVYGTTNDYFDVMNWKIADGRTFLPGELASGADVCVLGDTVAQELFGAQDPIGGQVRLGNLECRVIARLAPKGESTFGQDQDDLVVVPLATLQRRIAGDRDVGSIFLSAAPDADIPTIKRDIEALMRIRRHVPVGNDPDFFVRDMAEAMAMISSISAVLTTFLGAVAAISLLVGGIGIMNIMLVSVTERTREIGIRLAIGATAPDVMTQFLVESVVLSSVGGFAGVVVGLLTAALASFALDVPLVVDLPVVALAFGISAGIGVAFGYFPARRAARLDPIEALRHE